MAIYFEVANFDNHFYNTVSPIIVNDLPYVTIEDRQAFIGRLLTTCEGDVLSNVPTCACGHLQSGYNLNHVCPICDTTVTYPCESDIDTRVWIRVPEGVDGFISPLIWVQLTNILNKKGYNLLEWLINPRSTPPRILSKDTAKRIERFKQLGWERGLNNFIRHFDFILNEIEDFTRSKGGVELCNYVRSVRERVFPKYLPLPTKSMMILENTQIGSYADNAAIIGAINAAKTIVELAAPKTRPLAQHAIEGKVVKVIQNLIEYCTAMIKTNLCSKKGWFRGQVFSSRSHFAMRGVITSISEPHHYQELHIPWAQGLEIFKVHLVSKLVKRGWLGIAAYDLVESSGNIYVPILDELLQELIVEGPKIERIMEDNEDYWRYMRYTPEQINKLRMPKTYISCLFQRNPSLERLLKSAFYQ